MSFLNLVQLMRLSKCKGDFLTGKVAEEDDVRHIYINLRNFVAKMFSKTQPRALDKGVF